MLNASHTKNPSTVCPVVPVADEITVYTICITCFSPAGGRTTRPVSRYFASRSLAEKALPTMQDSDPTARIGAFTAFDPDPDYWEWYQDLVLLDESLEGGGL